MIISHNISALNTLNKLNKNNNKVADAMEKLSSGLRIKKASDDSAGLAISEKMRAQIRGLGQAQSNIQDGMSLIQTAESALSTIQDPNLLRLREMAIQAANDTLTHEDRQNIQKEVMQIKQDINDIANNTEFNGIKLLNRSIEETFIVTGVKTTFEWEETKGTNRSTRMALGTNGDIFVSNIAQLVGKPARFEYSYDGINWTTANSTGVNEEFHDITWDGNQFTAVGWRSVATSPDGINWTTSSSFTFQQVQAVTSNGSMLVAVGDSYDIRTTISGDRGRAMYSLDNGITWLTSNEIPPTNGTHVDLNDVVYGKNKFVAVGYSFGGSFNNNTVVATSNDGINWRTINLYEAIGAEENLQQVIFDGDHFVAVGENGIIITSNDGETWTRQTSGVTNDLIGITKGNDYFVATGYNTILASEDAINWVEIDNSGGGEIVWSDDNFLALGDDYLIGRILHNDITQSVKVDPIINLQVGANSDDIFQVYLTDIRTTALEVEEIDFSTRAGARNALNKIDKAMEIVSSERGKFGSYQNALEHVQNNVSNYELNLTTSESRIRDSDIAEQIMKMTKNQILSQVSQAMFSNTNQQPQQVLQLLK